MIIISHKEDILDMLDEVSEKLGAGFTLNKEKSDRLHEVCEYIDTVLEDFDVEVMDMSVDEVTKQFAVSIICPEMVLYHGRSHDFFKLIQFLDSFSFTKKAADMICVNMNIDSMWEVSGGC